MAVFFPLLMYVISRRKNLSSKLCWPPGGVISRLYNETHLIRQSRATNKDLLVYETRAILQSLLQLIKFDCLPKPYRMNRIKFRGQRYTGLRYL